jgi:hypothetical protein
MVANGYPEPLYKLGTSIILEAGDNYRASLRKLEATDVIMDVAGVYVPGLQHVPLYC